MKLCKIGYLYMYENAIVSLVNTKWIFTCTNLDDSLPEMFFSENTFCCLCKKTRNKLSIFNDVKTSW